MSFHRWFSAKDILGEALGAPEHARRLVVDARCGDDEDLRREVIAMLACHSGLADTQREVASPTVDLPVPGDLIGGRYRLEMRIGRGAFGRVHRARDERGGSEVALKLLSLGSGGSTPRALRRELAALRRARLPGIVELVDDGVENGVAFLVMRLVEGDVFPCAPTSMRWAALAPLAGSLLVAVGRLHAIHVLHRDLKPANALVEGCGRVVLVDLGIALDLGGGEPALGATIPGTPTHMAPEVLDGKPATVSSDIYAAGLMLFEALAGRSPHPAESIPELLALRCGEPAPRVDSLVERVPQHVADAIASALARDPLRRPASARDFHRRLFPGGAEPSLPRLGDQTPVERLTDAARSGRSVYIVGDPGTGRSRLLNDAEANLEAEGFRVMRTAPSLEPLGSLVPVISGLPGEEIVTLSDAEQWAADRTTELFGLGFILFVDDPHELDPSTERVLDAVRAHGAVAQVSGDAPPGAESIRVEPLLREDLRDLFHGPDRLFHLREDAGDALWARSRGQPGRVAATLSEWVRDGVIWREGEKFATTRAILDSILPALPVPPPFPGPGPELGHDARRLAGLLEVARIALSERVAAQALALPAWRMGAAVEDLNRAGVVLRDDRDKMGLTYDLGVAAEWAEEERRAVHSGLADALPRESEFRIDHLVAADRIEEVGPAACEVAEGLIRRGDAERAHVILGEALAGVRRERHVDVETEEAALELLLEASLGIGTVPALDALVYQVERSSSQSRVIVDIELLSRAALLTVKGDADRALSLTELPAPLSRDELERFRQMIRVVAGRTVDPARSREVLAEALSCARRRPFADRLAHVAEWLGWYHYRNLEFDRAASLHARAANRWRNPRSRVSARLNAASAAMEDGMLDRARELASTAFEAARRRRYQLAEVRASWLLRSIDFRSGAATEVDEELLEAAGHLGAGNLRGLFWVVEAAVAWRSGRALLAARLAREADRHLQSSGKPEPALLMRALAAAAGGGNTEDRDKDLACLTDCRLPRLRAQAAALFALAGAPVPANEREENLKFISMANAGTRSMRCEVLSLDEAREILKGR